MSLAAAFPVRFLIVPFLAVCTLLGQTSTTARSRRELPILAKTGPVEEGDRCIVCNAPLQASDSVYLVEGQRVGVMKAMEQEFLSDPWTYIRRLKPGGGLFGGEAAPSSGVSDVWMYFGFYVLLGLAFGALTAHRALDAGQPPVKWFVAGLFLNLFAYLALVVRGTNPDAPIRYGGGMKIPATVEPVLCSECDALNHPSATRCSKCGVELQPLTNSEVTGLHLGTN